MAFRVSTNTSEIRFSEIRPLDGKQTKGFEELCVQLLPQLISEEVLRVVAVDGRGGDGGIEAIAQVVGDLQIGLQAKYFTRLEAAQWRQIDGSVKTAMLKHPELDRYLVCVPLERTPEQIKKWNALVEKWSKLNPDFVVEWIGESILLGALLKPEVAHLRSYWFSCPEFSLDWIKSQTEIAIRQLHDRYTPKLHQATYSEQILEHLLDSRKAQISYKKQCSDMVVAWRKVLRELPDEVRDRPIQEVDGLRAAFHAMLVSAEEGRISVQRDCFVLNLQRLLAALEILLQRIRSNDDEQEIPELASYSEFSRRADFHVALERTDHVIRKATQYRLARNDSILILKGEAGTGKSHLLASLALDGLAEGRACLLMTGERFASEATLMEQIPSILQWQWSLGELLACLSAQAEISGRCSLLIIDAINEPRGNRVWRRDLLSLTAMFEKFPGVRLLVSCRSDCLQSILPPGLSQAHNTVDHQGFDLKFDEAIRAYFAGYQVSSAQFPTFNREFQNPLFLKTLCEAYQGRSIPSGAISFTNVLRAWEDRIAGNIEDKIGCPRRATGRAVVELVNAMAASGTARISADLANDICIKNFSEQRVHKSLYSCLASEGLLQEVESEGEAWVRLQYERFSDVRIAQMVLSKSSSRKQWLEYWKSEFLPRRVVDGGLRWDVAAELSSYAMLLPEMFGIELIECPIGTVIGDEGRRFFAKEILWDAWLDSLAWRSFTESYEKIRKMFGVWAAGEKSERRVWEYCLQFACIPRHPLNSDFLHQLLDRWVLPDRELRWNVALAHEDMIDQSAGSVVASYLHWVEASVGMASGEQVRLASQALLWLTGSSNRALRDRATDVAIRSLAGCKQAGAVCLDLLEKFWEVDDPYIKERLLAVMCGVLPRLRAEDSKIIASFVEDRFWKVKDVAPHILQREYAEFVIRHACDRGLLPVQSLQRLVNRTKKSRPRVWSEARVAAFEKDPGYGAIARSIRPEEMGMYGDFGRYVMGSAVHHFADSKRASAKAAGLSRGGLEHDARFARRYIWQRVIELGWTPERFLPFERSLGHSGRMRDRGRVERISKKYQWIGLHEYLGLLSDSFPFKDWGGQSRPLLGAWELHARDYCPELAFSVDEDRDSRSQGASQLSFLAGLIPSLKSEDEKRGWVQENFRDLAGMLRFEGEVQSWVVLKGHIDLKEEIGFGVERDGTARMSQWVDLRAFVVPVKNTADRVTRLRKHNFFGDGVGVPRCSQCWVSEYPWHPSFKEVDEECLHNRTWLDRDDFREGLYLPVCEISDDDCSILLPAPSFHKELGEFLGHPLSAPIVLRDGTMEIYDSSGSCVVRSFDSNGAFLLIDNVVLVSYLAAKNLRLVWGVLSEKSAWNGRSHVGGISNQSFVYVLEPDGSISGGHSVGESVDPRL